MTRQHISDPENPETHGLWFEDTNAEVVSQTKRGSWHGDTLFRTGQGRWIHLSWSAVQGEGDYFTLLTPSQAAIYLGERGESHPSLARELDALEIT